ncbi:MAG: hypothetical protein HQK81_15540 [Desulfovibrionaceae bacterium]|nr:hypothetical protein [Desulfovibrionaceae bacterium]MBF0515455.1 hypothetical protein [Desulfovibrionaceae bacterium]
MIKLVEGELQYWEYIRNLAPPKKSLVNQLFDAFVSSVEKSQALAPDLLPSRVSIHPSVDAHGKLIDTVSAGFKQPGLGQNGRLVDSKK